MDPLRSDDLEMARQASPEEKARQAFDAARTGIRLKRAGLRLRYPNASEVELSAHLQRWLDGDSSE